MYESHITVSEDENFIDICNFKKLKYVIIGDDTSSHMKNQRMTAVFHKTNDYEKAFCQMNEIASNFKNVIRRKLEKIVSKQTVIDFEYKYKEFHSKFEINSEEESEFLDIILSGGGQTSKNISKGSNFRFFTTRDEFLHDKILAKLKLSFNYLGTIREVVVYDDNPSIDSGYMCQDCLLKKYIK